MVLKPPPNVSETNFDTATWNIDKETLYFDNYITTMIEEMFLSGKVPMSRRGYAKILDLGLGGGYLNSYLHHNYPNMDITVVEHDPEILKISRKWFDLKEDERHRVMLNDAAQFVRNAAKNGQVYDIIFVDACGTKIKSWIICPNQDFTRYEMAENLAKLLTERGMFLPVQLRNQ
ncbi:hypothetical protein OESDEN_14746 [Oesophagostomum dentatum]|uniref:PABS domain-containing protein n=1 Tax=Oesophagostomum dentatum TaxID=61180 RepID=A0A0B1SNR1_OESDE|nr:hypothetical protein OESDEN_14746 [Oesophagostomum dentatum]